MGLLWEAGAVVEPVDLATAKLHLRVDHSDEDALISALITAARQYCENETSRIMTTQDWKLTLDAFPNQEALSNLEVSSRKDAISVASYPRTGVIKFPLSPVQSITDIKYDDTDGAEQTLNSALYRLEKNGLIARLSPVYGQSWPATRNQTGAVRIRFKVGFGNAASDVPGELKAAVLLMLGSFFENRQAITQGAPVQALPKPVAVSYLLSHWKVQEI